MILTDLFLNLSVCRSTVHSGTTPPIVQHNAASSESQQMTEDTSRNFRVTDEISGNHSKFPRPPPRVPAGIQGALIYLNLFNSFWIWSVRPLLAPCQIGLVVRSCNRCNMVADSFILFPLSSQQNQGELSVRSCHMRMGETLKIPMMQECFTEMQSFPRRMYRHSVSLGPTP